MDLIGTIATSPRTSFGSVATFLVANGASSDVRISQCIYSSSCDPSERTVRLKGVKTLCVLRTILGFAYQQDASFSTEAKVFFCFASIISSKHLGI